MLCAITPVSVRFRHGNQLAGEYVLNDDFKPHFCLLNTPDGHNTVVVSPGDHRHHKGLMYALRCTDLNFWEEHSGNIGIQENIRTIPVKNGFRQDLLWRSIDGGLETYQETREITCRLAEEGRAFTWTWKTRREALRDHELMKSEWAMELPDGRIINYHGLGIRLPWMWRFPGGPFGAVEVDGRCTDPAAACGTKALAVGFCGLIDGQWNPTRAAVTIRQQQDFSWYVLKGDFPYLAVGPTNADGFAVRAGEVFEESYEIIVEDR